jgi:hypothetical protein
VRLATLTILLLAMSCAACRSSHPEPSSLFILDLKAPVITAYSLAKNGPSWLLAACADGHVQQAMQSRDGAAWSKIDAQVDARIVAQLVDAFSATRLVSAPPVADTDSADIFMLKVVTERATYELQGGTHGGARSCEQINELAVYWRRLAHLLPKPVASPSLFSCRASAPTR